ncbi:MAG: protein tyrosine phosphatase [Bradyrhizobiaceae bacterium]|nr:protein tyrosine phosphatase [Bradyrhizobiaceae bacterium]
MIKICSLARLNDTVADSGARHVVTLVREEARVFRPLGIEPENHLWLQMDDIADAIDGMIPPGEAHVERLVEFAGRWDRAKPLVVHCFAGISRSTAAAFITACALLPNRDEEEIAMRIRSSSPTASPNPRLVALGDAYLGREGRMTRAIARIGYGVAAYEGVPFDLPLE